jgi:hypothetical protein
MGTIVQLGDVPNWVQAATSAATLYVAVRGHWQQQAVDWAQQLEQLSGYTTEELRRAVEASPALAELVGFAWEEAAKTSSEDKRRLLAKVVSAALRGDADAEVHALPYLLRTVVNLDPSHVVLLVIIARPEQPRLQPGPDQEVQRAISREEVKYRWPGASALLDPALAVLEREGLVAIGTDYNGSPRSWHLRPYGELFFRFLEGADEANLEH